MARPQVLTDLGAAYRQGGVAAAYKIHRRAMLTHTWYRLAFGLIDLVAPLTEIGRLLADLEGHLGSAGQQVAGERFLAALGWPYKVSVAAGSEAALAGAPAVFYSNHAGMLTPALFFALLPRADVRIVTHALVVGCGPNLARRLIPVRPRSRAGWLRQLAGGPPVAIPYLADKWLLPNQSAERAKWDNIAALSGAAQHVVAGGCLVIAPDGGAYNGRRWFPGLGRLLLAIARDEPRQQVWLVPVNVRHADDARFLGTVSRNPLLRRQARRWQGQPVEFVFGKAQTLEAALAAGGTEPAALVSHLQRDYEEQFPQR